MMATLGPALESKLDDTFEYVDVFRLNMSHLREPEDYTKYEKVIAYIRERAPEKLVVVDLQGPKLRVGPMNPLELRTNQEVILYCPAELTDEIGSEEIPKIPVLEPQLLKALKPDCRVFINDGRIRLKVTAVQNDHAIAIVERGGQVRAYKGINLPGFKVELSPLSDKDIRDIRWAYSVKADAIALSFVQTSSDIELLKGELRALSDNWNPLIISKIETVMALLELKDIVRASDVIMVARGDLAVEASYERVPLLQKEIISEARVQGKPCIVATQMLNSMVSSPMPERAELTDIANAILDGADMLMLSDETAIGRYPLSALEVLNAVIRTTETYKGFSKEVLDYIPYIEPLGTDLRDRIAWLSFNIAKHSKGPVSFAVYSEESKLPELIARYRHLKVLYLFSPNLRDVKLGKFTWGVIPQLKHFNTPQEFECFLREELIGELTPDETLVAVYKDNYLIFIER